MANKNIQMKPIGTGNYADTLHPETNSDQVLVGGDTLTSKINFIEQSVSELPSDFYFTTDNEFANSYIGDLNLLIDTGFYSADSSSSTNLPIDGSYSGRPWLIQVIKDKNTSGVLQIASQTIPNSGFYIRSRTIANAWVPWKDVMGNSSPIAVTLNTGWTAHSFTGNTPTYIRDASNTVYLTGIVIRASGAGGAVATLPVGYRPAKETRIYMTGVTDLTIMADGRIWCTDARIGEQIGIHISYKAIV